MIANLLLLLTSFGWVASVWAQEGSQEATEVHEDYIDGGDVTHEPAPEVVVPETRRAKPRKGSSVKNSKGTKARKRLQAESVIKSYYSIDGRRLDVDPD